MKCNDSELTKLTERFHESYNPTTHKFPTLQPIYDNTGVPWGQRKVLTS